MGFLEVAYHEGHALKLTNAARTVLFDGATVELVRPERATPAPKPEKRRAWLDGEEAELFEYLRQLRLEIARRDQVPPYVVFSDATLRSMAQQRPRNQQEMRAVSGVGQRKWERYGEQFLQAIREKG
jgi:ATP-dependent DNA helicase RecQ